MKLSSGVTGMRCVVGVHEMSDVEICGKEKHRVIYRVQSNHFHLKKKFPTETQVTQKEQKFLVIPREN